MRRLKPELSIKNAYAFISKKSSEAILDCSSLDDGIKPESEIVHNVVRYLIVFAGVLTGGYIVFANADGLGIFNLQWALAFPILVLSTVLSSRLFAIVFAMAGMYFITYRPCKASNN